MKKVGKDVIDYGLLGLSCLTPLIPCDVQKYLEKETGVTTKKQMAYSLVSEATEGAALMVIGAITNPIAIPIGFAVYVDNVLRKDAVFKDGVIKDSTASIVVEIPYRLGRKIKTRFDKLYDEAKNEVTNKAIV